MEVLKLITTINEEARAALGITRDEYALCSYVHYRSADPRQKKPGFCCDNKEQIADFIGITRPGLFKMTDRLQAKNLLFVDSVTRAIQVTAEWVMVENNTKSRKQSLHDRVNKVNTECKQSLHDRVNKVTHNIEVKKDNKKEEIEVKQTHTPTVTDVPRFNTPTELEEHLRNFFSAYPEEWRLTLEAANMAYSQNHISFNDTERKTAISKYCEWAVEEIKMHHKSFAAHNARLRRWLRYQASMSVSKSQPTSAGKGSGIQFFTSDVYGQK